MPAAARRMRLLPAAPPHLHGWRLPWGGQRPAVFHRVRSSCYRAADRKPRAVCFGIRFTCTTTRSRQGAREFPDLKSNIQVSVLAPGRSPPARSLDIASRVRPQAFNKRLCADQKRLVRVEGWVHIFSGTAELNGVKLTVLRPNGTHRNSGVLGNVDGSYFIYVPPPPSEIATFFGRQGNFLDALGVYVRNLAIPK
jgi:hypothetical protein